MVLFESAMISVHLYSPSRRSSKKIYTVQLKFSMMLCVTTGLEKKYRITTTYSATCWLMHEYVFYISYSHSDKERLPGSEARWGVFLHQGQGAETKLVDWLIGVQWGEIGVHLAIILSNVEAVGINILTVERCDKWVWRQTEKEGVTQKRPLTRVCTHLSLGSLPSLVYCQQMRPMRSWTRALAMVTTVIGCIFSWAICIER